MRSRTQTIRRMTVARCAARLFAILPAAAMFLLAGCGDGDTTGPAAESEIAVFGYLYVNETVSEENAIYLTRTMPVFDYYSREEAVITGAVVTLRKDGAETADTLSMTEPGYYSNPSVSIEPVATYHLSVSIEGEETITATTTTPWPFDVLNEPLALPDSMIYSTIADSFPIHISCENEEQIFQVDAYCLEEWEDATYVYPFGPEDNPGDYEEYGGDNGEPRHIAPYFKVKGLEREGEAYRIGWYGDLFVFYGEYDLQVLSLDDNFYNYLYRNHPELNGGINGGIGVFGSACRALWRLKVVE